MALIIVDSGVLYSLTVVTKTSPACRSWWQSQDLWVPGAVESEIDFRVRNSLPSLPPELPGSARGLLSSSAWTIQVQTLNDHEAVEADDLCRRLGGNALQHRGEAEAALLYVRSGVNATLAIDDASCIAVLNRFVEPRTGRALRYVSTSDVLDQLQQQGRITTVERQTLRTALTAKGRPFT